MSTPLPKSVAAPLSLGMMQSLLEVSTALSYEDFARGVVKFLGTSLDFHAAEVRLCVFDEATERALHLSGNFSAKAAHSAEELKLRKRLAPVHRFLERHPQTTVYRGHGQTLPVRCELERSQFFKEFMGPEGWSDYLGMRFFNSEGVRDGWVFVNRAHDQPHFNDTEVALFHQVHPMFAGALRRVHLLANERALRGDLEESLFDLPVATLLLDWRLQVEQANRAASRACLGWLHGAVAERTLKPPARIEVPREILAACEELKGRWQAGMAASRALKRTVPHPAQPGLQAAITLLRPHALRLATPSFLVRITDSPPDGDFSGRGAPDLVARLSPAERDLVPHLARGATNAEIAAGLGKSLATVKNQVHTILEKLELKNRAQLAARLRG